MVGYSGFDRLQIIELGMYKAFGQGGEPFLYLFLSGSGQGGECPAMERVGHRDDFKLSCTRTPQPCQFDQPFVGLRAGVAEKAFPAAGLFGERLGELRLFFVVIQV